MWWRETRDEADSFVLLSSVCYSETSLVSVLDACENRNFIPFPGVFLNVILSILCREAVMTRRPKGWVSTLSRWSFRGGPNVPSATETGFSSSIRPREHSQHHRPSIQTLFPASHPQNKAGELDSQKAWGLRRPCARLRQRPRLAGGAAGSLTRNS